MVYPFSAMLNIRLFIKPETNFIHKNKKSIWLMTNLYVSFLIITKRIHLGIILDLDILL